MVVESVQAINSEEGGGVGERPQKSLLGGFSWQEIHPCEAFFIKYSCRERANLVGIEN
jgi:hypothetical protein